MNREQDRHEQFLVRVRHPHRPSAKVADLVGEARKHHDTVGKKDCPGMRGANIGKIAADRIVKILIGGAEMKIKKRTIGSLTNLLGVRHTQRPIGAQHRHRLPQHRAREFAQIHGPRENKALN